MEGSEYGSTHLPSPALVVFSQAANGLGEALRIQRPFHSQVFIQSFFSWKNFKNFVAPEFSRVSIHVLNILIIYLFKKSILTLIRVQRRSVHLCLHFISAMIIWSILLKKYLKLNNILIRPEIHHLKIPWVL